jgi:hypothetical protein
MATPKQVQRRGRWSLILGTLFAFVAFAAVAYADDISNDLDASPDVVAEVMPLNVGGADGTTQLYLNPKNGDGKPGCNITGGTSLGLSVSSNNTSVATVSPSSVTFTSCGDLKTLTVHPVSEGSATISVTQTSNTTPGTFDLAAATFTVNVAPPPNTAPSVEVAGVDPAASYSKGSVPAATCQVTDAEDGNSSFAATLSAITGAFASDGIGSQTASCSYTDDGGLTASGSETYSIIDPSPPTIGYTLDPASADGSDGWYTSSVSLTWDVGEPESPNSLLTTGCDNQSITADQLATSYSCSATSAGGSAGPVSVSVKRDATAPIVSGAPTTSPNPAGWYKHDVTIDWTCSDATSGLAAGCPADSTIFGEGTGLTASSGNVFDNAGNFSSAISAPAVDIDKTAPTVALVGGPTNGASYYFGSVPAAPACTASDALSGLAAACSVSGYSAAVGSHTVTASATDKADNQSSASSSYTVLAWTLKGFYQPVDMNGVVNIVKNGSTVPLKFEIFAGATESTDTGDVDSLTATQIDCDSSSAADDIEVTATGGTSLRYDATAGQFIYNWQTPKKPGNCYRVTMTTDDGSSLVALFKLK